MRTCEMHLKDNCDKNNKNMEKKEPKEQPSTMGLRSNWAVCIQTERRMQSSPDDNEYELNHGQKSKKSGKMPRG